jgi:beta-glucanase (GH16 family)
MPDPTVTELCTATDQGDNVLGDYAYRLNGHISTQHQVDFLYGVAAARMKFQRDPGAHTAFWLQPRGLLDTGPTPWGAEIDVVEWYGAKNGRSRLSSTVHAPLPSGAKVSFGGPVSKPDQFLLTRSDSWWHRFHVFSVEWTPTEYVFRISGHEVWRTDQGISHDPEFLILSMLSSDFELAEPANVQGRTQTATVDWVKVWQADPSVGS